VQFSRKVRAKRLKSQLSLPKFLTKGNQNGEDLRKACLEATSQGPDLERSQKVLAQR
jgi:hypothetical protein